MTAVSLQCKIWNHHPEWSNVSILHISDIIHGEDERKIVD